MADLVGSVGLMRLVGLVRWWGGGVVVAVAAVEMVVSCDGISMASILKNCQSLVSAAAAGTGAHGSRRPRRDGCGGGGGGWR